MRYSFSGHESFICKSLWLKKGYDFINKKKKFSSEDSVISLGVGKNMVSSIRYWMKAFGLSENDELTDVAHSILSDDGYDPYIEDNGTLWILHYQLVSTCIASIYNLIFLSFQRETKNFDKDQILSFIKRKCNVPEQKNVFNENTVKKDIRVFLQNYVMPTELKSLEDFTALLIDLKLIRQVGDGHYIFNETRKESIDSRILLYCMLDKKGTDMTVSFDTLQELSLVFCLPIVSLIEKIQELELIYPDVLKFTDNSGIKNVQFLNSIEKKEVLNSYYRK